ncbi:MAG: 3-deoxy-D-manno-octulosonic acid transferase [Planctomycetes bacterium]|nr:3-deoxy-D-manno-octulosonic acid transferase [Planctomycetota bacterium]
MPNQSAAIPPPILADPNPGVVRWVLHAVYDCAWIVVILLTSPWWIYRSFVDGEFRAMVRARLALGLEQRPRGGRRSILVHGVSVGEVKGAQALVRHLERARPDLDIVICTTTKNGLRVAHQTYPQHTVVRFPLDLSFVVKRFLKRIDPVCVVLVELEIWPNFLRCANQAGAPVAVVNGRITDKSFASYKLFKDLLPQFNRISLFCVQDQEYAQRFERLSAKRERILITGNIKVDGLATGRGERSAELVRLLGGASGQSVIVAGSTHEPEESRLVEAWLAHARDARLVIVPRHPERAEALVRTLEAAGVRPQRLTELRNGEHVDPRRPCLADTIGELEAIYRLADLVFVGGSLIPHGGQNMLEPAALERAVIYGPYVQNFTSEAALLERSAAALRIDGPAQLGPTLAALLADPARRERMGRAGRAAVEAQRGATELTLAALTERVLPHS